MNTVLKVDASIVDANHLEFVVPRGESTLTAVKEGDLLHAMLFYDAEGKLWMPEGWRKVAHQRIGIPESAYHTTQVQHKADEIDARRRRIAFEFEGCDWLGQGSTLWVLRTT